MEYLALVYGDPDSWEAMSESDEQRHTRGTWRSRATRTLRERSSMRASSNRRAAATSVRVRNGEAIVTDGPYAEVKESLGGYYLFSCDSFEDAIDWAARIPAAWHGGAIEVRPSTSKRRQPHEVRNARVQRPVAVGRAVRRGGCRLRAESMPRWITLFEEMGKADPNVTGQGARRARRRRRSSASSTARRSSRTARSPRRRSSSAASSSTELPDLDEAIRLAALVPAAEYGTLEIRPLATPVNDGLAAVYAEEWPRCVAILTRVLGDLERAEDAVQDAFAIALERWPRTGCPTTRVPGSSRPPATGRSTGSGVTMSSPTRPRCSRASSRFPRTPTR